MRVKICGLTRPEDIAAVNEAMPDYCGFIINYRRSRRNIDWKDVGDIRNLLRPEVVPVGVFVNDYAPLVAEVARIYAIPIVQLHGQEPNSEIDLIRERAVGIQIWKAFRMRDERDVIQANNSHADLILLDAGRGSGTTFDRSLVAGIQRPFALAGGLNIDNIPEALKTGAVLLDVSSGAETDGQKDPEKIKTIVSMIKGA